MAVADFITVLEPGQIKLIVSNDEAKWMEAIGAIGRARQFVVMEEMNVSCPPTLDVR